MVRKNARMAMGRREQQRRQEGLWIAHTELPRTAAHPFYEPLNRVLEERGFDEFVEQQGVRFYAERMGRRGLAPGRYFRLLLVGYFGVALISFGVITTG
jgi:transposase